MKISNEEYHASIQENLETTLEIQSATNSLLFAKDKKGFVKHYRMKISDMKRERRFEDSSMSSSKYMIELNKYKW